MSTLTLRRTTADGRTNSAEIRFSAAGVCKMVGNGPGVRQMVIENNIPGLPEGETRQITLDLTADDRKALIARLAGE